MLSLFNAGSGIEDQGAAGKSFSYGLRRARLNQINNDPTLYDAALVALWEASPVIWGSVRSTYG
jgi:hypothetical protein